MPLTVGSGSLRMGCSVGMALFPDDAEDPALLLARADAQMYHRKRLARQAGGDADHQSLSMVDTEPAS